MRVVLHIDVNNAFLSWTALELLENGSKYDIRNSFAVIGGDEKSRHGIVLAKSMKAKKLGIKTADTISSARKKCNALSVYPPDYKYYQKKSTELFQLLSEYTPDIEIASIDECYLEFTNIAWVYKDPLEFSKMIQKRILDELGFTVNIGIANNKLCAKMASDFEKPYKIHTLYDNEVQTKMWPLPIGDLFGIGKKSVIKLNKLGIKTIGDLAHFDSKKLYPYFKNQSTRIIEMAHGIDNSIVNSGDIIPKGIGNEMTLLHDVTSIVEVKKYLLELSELVGRRLRNQKKYAKVVCVVIKDSFFKRKSHQRKLNNPTSSSKEIYENAVEIFNEFWDLKPIRLIGIRLDNLVDINYHQVSIFDTEKNEVSEKLDYVLDEINKKYGKNMIKSAGLKETKKRGLKQ
ncbi:MAG: DNA polymerase IV [Bacilli bacterium]|nr:DNA polymerase IV [Bacilli bacterium]